MGEFSYELTCVTLDTGKDANGVPYVTNPNLPCCKGAKVYELVEPMYVGSNDHELNEPIGFFSKPVEHPDMQFLMQTEHTLQ